MAVTNSCPSANQLSSGLPEKYGGVTLHSKSWSRVPKIKRA